MSKSKVNTPKFNVGDKVKTVKKVTDQSKVGFSSFDEVIKYMKCGGYVLAELLKDDFVCYRIKKGVLEINAADLSESWDKSFFDISDLQRGSITNISKFTKRKYA